MVGLPLAVSGVRLRIALLVSTLMALLVSTLMASNELRGSVHILGTIGSGLLGRKHHRGDASTRCSMNDA